MKPDEAVKRVGMVVERINAIPAALTMSKQYGAWMPIASAVDAIINKGADPSETVRKLMERGKKREGAE